MEAIEYAFANLRSPNGLLYWGNTTAYDIWGDEAFGWRIGNHYVHVLKAHLPYYELMWQVNPDVTKTFIESFWSAHILDWSNLDMNRISRTGWNWQVDFGKIKITELNNITGYVKI
ncbi:hypothetical protein ES703_41946 [subsurface metagenome]